MTILQPSVPTLLEEDNFRLEYHGTYGEVGEDPEHFGKVIITEIKGPIPKGRFLFDSRDYLGGMEAGQARLVPFNVVRIYWGDPRSVTGQFGRTKDAKGQVGDIAPREQEVRRLAQTYGVGADYKLIAAMVPRVTILTADDVEVICPATDIDGEHIYGLAPDTAEVHDVATQLAKMRQQIALLEAQSKVIEANGKNDGSDVVHDGPRRKA